MMRMEISFDESKVASNGYTMEQVRGWLKDEFAKFNFPCVADGDVMVFTGVGNSKDYGRMLIMMMDLNRAEWFMETASSWIFSVAPPYQEDILSRAMPDYLNRKNNVSKAVSA